MSRSRIPSTPAVRLLKQREIPFVGHLYAYQERGGTAVCARELQVDEHAVIKTLVMEDDRQNPLVVLMHGDRQVSTKKLARILGVRQVTPCTPERALRQTGYQVGGTSPLGTRNPLPVYVESSILELPVIYLNGGKRGFLVALDPRALLELLTPVPVQVAIEGSD